MLSRFKRVHQEFGIVFSVRIVLLLLGLVGMSALGAFMFQSPWPAVVTVVGLALGWILRRRIVDSFDALTWAFPAALFVFSVVLFIGEQLGLSREGQLLITTLTTVFIFDLQFWWFSDPSIVRSDGDTKG